jgi:hypothetical protein
MLVVKVWRERASCLVGIDRRAGEGYPNLSFKEEFFASLRCKIEKSC